jgi:hypothetical protein
VGAFAMKILKYSTATLSALCLSIFPFVLPQAKTAEHYSRKM